MIEARIKVLGHSAHQMLVPVTIGLLIGTAGLDAWQLRDPSAGRAEAAFMLLVATILTGAVAAMIGWLDWGKIPGDTRAKSVGLTHGLGNALLLVMLVASWLLRRDEPTTPSALALWLTIASAALGGVTAWLGGELVSRLGIGVSPGAHPNAPSSLTTP